MELTTFLSPDDAERAQRTLKKLWRRGMEPLVLTGGLAIELHRLDCGQAAEARQLNDIDLLVDMFAAIPTTFADDLIFRHVHPHDPPGKTLLQGIAMETAARVDVFRAYGDTMERAVPVKLCGMNLRMVSLEDLTARTARLCMDLAANLKVPAKHTRDFLRLLAFVEIKAIEPIWADHRKSGHPALFAGAAQLLSELIVNRKDLQFAPVYSRDPDASCARCSGTGAFPLAEGGQVLSLLGYC